MLGPALEVLARPRAQEDSQVAATHQHAPVDPGPLRPALGALQQVYVASHTDVVAT